MKLFLFKCYTIVLSTCRNVFACCPFWRRSGGVDSFSCSHLHWRWAVIKSVVRGLKPWLPPPPAHSRLSSVAKLWLSPLRGHVHTFTSLLHKHTHIHWNAHMGRRQLQPSPPAGSKFRITPCIVMIAPVPQWKRKGGGREWERLGLRALC